MAAKAPAQARHRGPADFTELRVHGVGGTPPENLLDHSEVEQVAGDGIAGFYRRPGDNSLEAYSWGGTTAKAATRALWLLLLPFALANVAGWMITTRPGEQTWIATWIKGLVRIFALAITALYVMWIGLMSVDLVAYQCGGQTACFDSRWWLKFFGNNYFLQDPARRLAVGLVVPLALLALFVFLVKRSQDRYERVFDEEMDEVVGDDTGTSEVDDGDPALDADLSSRTFWHGSKFVGRLARLHLAAGFAGVATIVAYGAWQLDQKRDETLGNFDNLQFPLFVVGIAVCAAIAVGVLAIRRVDRKLSWGYFYASVGLFAAVALELLIHNRGDVAIEPQAVDPQLLPGYSTFALPAIATLVLLMLGILVLQLLDRDRRRLGIDGKAHKMTPEGKMQPLGFWRGFGPFFVSIASTLTTALLLAGAVVRVGDWLGDRPCPEGEACAAVDAGIIHHSYGYEWFALILLLAVVGMLLNIVVRILKLGSEKAAHRSRFGFEWGPGWRNQIVLDAIDAEYAKTPDSRSDPCRNAGIEGRCGGKGATPEEQSERQEWLIQVSKARRVRSALGSGDKAGGIFLAGAVVIAFAVLGARWILAGELTDSPRPVWSWLEFMVAPATWLAAAVPLGAIWGIRQSIKSEGTRRKVGIVWDVITFWPRWYHPLAPPSYASRAIPQLGLRLSHLTTGGRKVVLSAHSQGTVVAAATLLRAGPPIRDRVALLTHGSPLRHLYGKFFPAFFGTEAMHDLRIKLTDGDTVRWRNLYRLTDPIGGAIFGETPREPWIKDREHGDPTDREIDELVPDPLSDRHLPADPCPEPEGHSNYFSDPQPCRCPPYERAIDTLGARLGVAMSGERRLKATT